MRVQPGLDAVTPGVLDNAACGVYAAGQCHALALAIHEATGWELVGDWNGTAHPQHVLVRHPSGELIDLNWVVHGTTRLWGNDQREMEPEDVWQLARDNHYYWPDVDLARSFVKFVLDEVWQAM